MITICIPVYNYNITSLAMALYKQVAEATMPVEVVVIEDGSVDHLQENRNACQAYKHVVLKKNIGRAAIRNLFLQYANFPYLLFLDCDSLIISNHFLQDYISVIQKSTKVICGGRIYEKLPPSKNKLLRWKYGVMRESKPADSRQKYPHRSFMTNNFLVEKDVLKAIPFDERLKDYGHEDTLFGIALKQNNIEVLHIDNPVLNGEIETNEDYLRKTEGAIKNLVYISSFVQHNYLQDEISLFRFYKKMKPLMPLVLITFKLLGSQVRKRLTQGKVNLYLFDYYKLGTFLKYRRGMK